VRPPINENLNIPITIRYGDATRVISDVTIENVEAATVTINILGDRYQPFLMPPYEVEFSPENIVGNDLKNLNFETSEGGELTFLSENFPTSASGLAAGILVGRSGNDTYYGSVEGQIFEGEERPMPPKKDENDQVESDPVEEQRIAGDIGSTNSNAFCEESSSDTLATSRNPLTVDERLLPEDIDRFNSEQASDSCNQEEEEAAIVSDVSETDEENELASVVEQ
jgi:hypothetical protein